MKTHGLIFLLFFIGSQVCTGQTTADNRYNFQGNSYGILTVKIDTASLKRFKLVQNKAGIPHDKFVKPYLAADSNIFITSTGLWDLDYTPLGLFVSEGKTINPIDLSDGKNYVFALKPNGVFMITDKEALIVESSTASKYPKARLAFQSCRMIVMNGQIPGKIDAIGINYFSGVGIYEYNGANYLVFAASQGPVSLYAFASLFKVAFKCTNALELSGGGDRIIYTPFINSVEPLDNEPPIGSYIIYTNHN